ncbi:hypothetical protein T12_16033 [Trichinella patagoniensis]|uniref:Uncharacterized protein n=1 Tax=Trichinella patagoniensis TaxID=990121 RepID=A0A0V0Z9J6_9BILA|nr:hypothetical protein T12_16033 [Trichinella patagoniensis]
MEQVFSAVAYQISEQGARTDMLVNKLESRKTRLSFMVRK